VYDAQMHLLRVWLLACAAMAGLSCNGQPLHFAGGDLRESGAGGGPSASSGGTGGSDPLRDAAADLQAGDAVGAPAEASDGRANSQSPDGAKIRSLSIVLQNAPWNASQATSGMAVDSLGRVYLGDHDNVYRVDGIWASTYQGRG